MASGAALDATTAVLTAIRTAIISDGTLGAALAGSLQVVTGAPSSYPCPFISMDIRSNDWSTATEDGQEVMLDLNIWTQPASLTPEMASNRAIMDRLRQILHTATLSLASPFHAVQCRVDNQIGPYEDPDGATLHGVVSLRLLVDHT